MSNSSARSTSQQGLQGTSVCFSQSLKRGKSTSCGHVCSKRHIHVRLNLKKPGFLAAQMCSTFGAGMDCCWRRCGKRVGTCAIGARICPFCGAGPQAKTTPAPRGSETCAMRKNRMSEILLVRRPEADARGPGNQVPGKKQKIDSRKLSIFLFHANSRTGISQIQAYVDMPLTAYMPTSCALPTF